MRLEPRLRQQFLRPDRDHGPDRAGGGRRPRASGRAPAAIDTPSKAWRRRRRRAAAPWARPARHDGDRPGVSSSTPAWSIRPRAAGSARRARDRWSRGSRPIAASIRSNSAPASPSTESRRRILAVGMSAIDHQPGSRIAGRRRSRRVAGAAKGIASVPASQAWKAVEVSGKRLGGRPEAAPVRARRLQAGPGASQSRGSSPTSVSTPASSHQARALSAQRDDMPTPILSNPLLESARRGLVNREIAVYLPDVGCLRRQERLGRER